METTAEILMRAAATLRERAEDATSDVRWVVKQMKTGIRPHWGGDGLYAWVVPLREAGENTTPIAERHNGASLADIDYIALVDPTVGLALADLLETEAKLIDFLDGVGGGDPKLIDPALTLARAILRETGEEPNDQE